MVVSPSAARLSQAAAAFGRPVTRRALFLGIPFPEVAGAMRGWLSTGNEIAAFWYPRPSHAGHLHRDRRLALLAPRWSTTGIARRNNIEMREVPILSRWPERLKAAQDLDADVLISALFDYRVPTDMLEIFGRKAVNLHPAPLPAYRGPHATQWMILHGSIRSQAAVTLHVMSAEFDTGDVIASCPVSFPADGSLTRYSMAVAEAARHLTAHALPRYLAGEIVSKPQDADRANYCRLTSAQLMIGPHLDSETVRFMCETFGSIGMLSVAGAPSLKVAGFRKVVGPASGEPPRQGLFSIDLDVSERRVRLKRKLPWSSAGRKLRALALQICT
jgi:methionyl-tRNA formyltransferase